MNATVPTSATALSQLGADNIPDSRGINLYRADPDLGRLLGLYLPAGLKAHLEPHLDRLGALAADELDELAGPADRNGPELRPRTRRGEDPNAIPYHPASRAIEPIALGHPSPAARSHPAAAPA